MSASEDPKRAFGDLVVVRAESVVIRGSRFVIVTLVTVAAAV